jgi:hypothetical protein
MTVFPCCAFAICHQDAVICFGVVRLQPRQQGGPKIETYVLVIVDFCRAKAGKTVGTVAFGVNSLVPIVKWRGARLRFDFTGPGILAWRLIEMSVNN